MKLKDFIAVRFPQEESKTYYAIVTKILPDNKFECRFVHSGSMYTFKLNSGWLEVAATTGAFKVGTRTNNVQVFTETDQFPLAVNTNARVTFDDGNAYLGVVKKLAPMTEISFIHSGNTYSFDQNNVAHKTGSPYDGRKALEIKVYTHGKNLFSGTHDASLSLSINDDFGKPLNGEFAVTIKRTDNDQIVYENTFLPAGDSTANDHLGLTLNEGQNLIILVDFYPSMEPYDPNPISSPIIDRNTSISGSKTFTFKNIPNLHFDVLLQNEVSTVTSTSGKEAVQTKYSEVSTNTSHTFETKFEGEAGIKLFGIGGTVTGGGGTSDTDGSGTSAGSSDSSGTSAGVSSTWNVYYPRGLKITPTFN